MLAGMVEPATGVSGALGALSGVRPPTGGGESGSLSGAAQELSAAARGLQSAQGQIAGQTMAINQMSISGQQQTQQLSMLVNQLNMSVGQLIGALNASAGAQRMAAMPTPPPQAFMPPPMAMDAMGGGFQSSGMVSQIGSGASNAVMNAARAGGGLFTAGARAAGTMAGAMAAPFIPGSYTGAQPGQQFGSVGNAGMARSMMMGIGMTSLSRQDQQRSNAGEVSRLAGERGAFKMGEIMLGAGAGLVGFGANQLGGSLGSAIGSRALGGVMGSTLGGLAGGVLGGGVIGAALMAPVNQTMDQIGAIRGTGEMLGRNAFRFNAPGRGDRPSFRERSGFGRSMLNEATSDLTFDNNDMQQMFSGAIENDLMRGVGNTQQARQRMRQLKESVKIIGQTLGTTIQESMSLMGDLQGVGIGPGGATRALANANVSGLTRTEALQGQMSFMNRFAGSGLQGQGLANLAAQSQQMGQVAMRNGSLSAEQIAGAGGRAGVNQAYGQGMTTLMQGAFGQMNMAARMGAGSFGGVSGSALGAMGQAGGAANTQNLISFAANKNERMRSMLNDPASQARMLQQIAGEAGNIARNTGGDRDDIMKLMLKQQGIDDPSVFMATLKAQPQALREQMRMQQRALAEMQVSQATENFTITGKLGRATQGATLNIAGGISGYMAGVQDTANNAITDLRNDVLGIREVSVNSGSLSVENLRKLKPDRLDPGRKKVMNAKPSEAQIKKAKIRAFKSGMVVGDSTFGLGRYIKNYKESQDPVEREELAKTILHRFSAGEAFSSPEMQKAYEQALSEQWGIDLSNAMNGKMGGLSKTEREDLSNATKELREAMDQDSGTGILSVAGGLAGGLAGVIFGPAGIAAGTAVGMAAVSKYTSGAGITQETAQRMAQSDSVKAYLESVQAGRPDDELLMKVKQEGFTNEETMQLQTLGRGGKAGSVLKSLSTMRELGGREVTSAIMERAGGVAGLSLKEAGGAGSDIAAALGGGTPEGVAAALAQLRGLDKKDRGELLAKTGVVGDVLQRASELSVGSTLKDLMAAGISEEQAKKVLGGSNALTAETLSDAQMMAVGQLGATEGKIVTGANGRAGFTQQQTIEQLKLSDNIARTAETLRMIEESLSSQGLIKPVRRK